MTDLYLRRVEIISLYILFLKTKQLTHSRANRLLIITYYLINHLYQTFHKRTIINSKKW